MQNNKESLFYYQCSQCQRQFPLSKDLMVCPECSSKQKSTEPLLGVLDVVLPLNKPPQFDIHNFLPIPKDFFPSIPVGKTPLWSPQRLQNKHQLTNLYLKDEGVNPTGSLKDRASFLVAAMAKQFQCSEIVLASTGNAGSSMAGIGAAAGLKVTLFLPHTAPLAKIAASLQYGAHVILVDGNYDQAYDLSLEYCHQTGALSRSTAYNPLTIEGKKTVGLEIFQQLQKSPDYIFVSAGDGVILSGVYKAFRDLLTYKLISHIPQIVAVQAEGSNAIYRAFHEGHFNFQNSQTVADSICVDIPRNGYHALKNLKSHQGNIICVSDNEILNAQKDLSATTGLFSEPAGATAYAGFLKYRHEISSDKTVVIITTGHGLKDITSALKSLPPLPRPIKNLKELKKGALP